MFYSRRGEKRRRGTVQLGPLHGVASGRRRLSPGARAPPPPPGSAEAGGDRGDRRATVRKRKGAHAHRKNKEGRLGPRAGGTAAGGEAGGRVTWGRSVAWCPAGGGGAGGGGPHTGVWGGRQFYTAGAGRMAVSRGFTARSWPMRIRRAGGRWGTAPWAPSASWDPAAGPPGQRRRPPPPG